MKKKKLKSDDYIKIEEKEKDSDKEKVIEEVKEEAKKEKDKKVEIKEDVEKEKKMVSKPEGSKPKTYKHPFTNFILVLVLLSSVTFFILSLFYEKDFGIATMISNLLLVAFALVYVTFSMTVNRKNKSLIFLSGLFMLGYFVYGSLLVTDVISFKNTKVINFTNMELTDVIKWSEENKRSCQRSLERGSCRSLYRPRNGKKSCGLPHRPESQRDVPQIQRGYRDRPDGRRRNL